MAVTYLNTGTISETLDKDTIEFTVSAVTNIVKGTLLVIQGEAMLVRTVDTTNVPCERAPWLRGHPCREAPYRKPFFSAMPDTSSR